MSNVLVLRNIPWKYRVPFVIVIAIAFISFLGVMLAEVMLHLPHQRIDGKLPKVVNLLKMPHENAEVESSDGLKLKAWYFPVPDSRKTVILVHGQGANRVQMIPFVYLFLRHRFNVLVPDLRGHGESEGHEITYGVKEPEDIERWITWLQQRQRSRVLYGFGESMGGSILLQSLAHESRLRGIIAEGPYATFRDVAYDRVSRVFFSKAWLGKTVLWSLVESGMLCAKYINRVDLDQVSPASVVKNSEIPILLIHGTADFQTPVYHSEMIRENNPSHIELWLVPHAEHVRAFFVVPQQYEKRVFDWIKRTKSARRAPGGTRPIMPARSPALHSW